MTEAAFAMLNWCILNCIIAFSSHVALLDITNSTWDKFMEMRSLRPDRTESKILQKALHTPRPNFRYVQNDLPCWGVAQSVKYTAEVASGA